MPSGEHESPIELVKVEPRLAAALVAERSGMEIPLYARAGTSATDVKKLVSTYHSDARLVYRDENDLPVLAIIYENQLGYDPDKRWTWPLYVAHSDIDDRVDTVLLVYCPTRALARWSAQLFADGLRSMRLRLYFVTPDDVPLVTTLDEAREAPERAVFATLCHRDDLDEATIFPLLAEALRAADPTKARSYDDALQAGLPPHVAAHWEAFMTTTAPQYRSAFYRGALAEGLAEGEAKGEAKGKAEAKADSVLTVLDARGLTVTDRLREMITTCTDLDQLDAWLRRAATVSTAEHIFSQPRS
jgi:hypothetical protein